MCYITVCIVLRVLLLSAATYVGGGFIMATAEVVYNPTMGLTWAVMPLTASLSFFVGKKLSQASKTLTLYFPCHLSSV